MTSWLPLPRLGFDTETTGINVRRDRIVTCSLILTASADALNAGVEERERFFLLNPGVEIPAGAQAVHGISTEYAQENGQDAKSGLEEIASILVCHMSKGFPVVAYNASYDFTLLDNELRRYGLASLGERLGVENAHIGPVLDPFLIDKYLDKYRRGKRRLENLCEHYGVASETFHDAAADVRATLRVLDAEIERYPQLGETSLENIRSSMEASFLDTHRFFQELALRNGRRPAADPRGWPITY